MGRIRGLRNEGAIPAKVKFQISLPTPIAPTYNNMVPADRPGLLPALTQHFIGEVGRIAGAMPHDRIALQWDVCQEVLAWEGYYDKGPVDFRAETIDVLTAIDGVDFAEAWPSRLITKFADQSIAVLSREHLIKNKRAAGRTQDLADVERLLGKEKKQS